jgi:hypothetical protein
MRLVTSSLIACLIASPLVAEAGGYDKATWGMTFAQVKTLYPGGVSDFGLSGKGENWMLFTDDSTFKVLATFFFPQGKLEKVMAVYSNTGSKSAFSLTREQANALGLKVRRALEPGLGNPVWTPANGPKHNGETLPADSLAVWELPDTFVLLLLQPVDKNSPGLNMAPVAFYAPKPAKPPGGK